SHDAGKGWRRSRCPADSDNTKRVARASSKNVRLAGNIKARVEEAIRCKQGDIGNIAATIIGYAGTCLPWWFWIAARAARLVLPVRDRAAAFPAARAYGIHEPVAKSGAVVTALLRCCQPKKSHDFLVCARIVPSHLGYVALGGCLRY